MTPKEAAEQIVGKYMQFAQSEWNEKTGWDKTTLHLNAKSCAILHCQGIIEAIDFDWMEVQNLDRVHNYWEQVINEINKM